jgi:hypothetical protein
MLAAHLYIHLAIRELPGTAKMHLKMLYDLRWSFPSDITFLFFQASDTYLRILLWILFIGAAGTFDTDARVFFVQNMQNVCAVLGVETRGDCEEVLRSVLWLDGWCVDRFDGIWKEVDMGSGMMDELIETSL